MSALGYLPYLAFVFLPGLGAGELFQLWRDDGFTARLAYALGIGLCVDTIVLVVRTAGTIGLLSGLDSVTVYAVTASGLLMLTISIVLRRRFSWWSRPARIDVLFLGVLFLQGLMILLYFQKYPIFPTSTPPDFFFHVSSTKALITGSISSIPHGILYYGVYYQLAPALLLVGGTAMVTVRWTMAVLAVLSTLLFFLAGQRLTGSKTCGLIVSVLYAFSGAIWFGMAFSAGLYSNFFGVLAVLFLLVTFLDAAMGTGARSAMITLALATVAAYFSHYSTVTILPTILVFPLVNMAFNRRTRLRSWVAAGVVIIPGLLGALAYPHIVTRILYANQMLNPLVGSSGLSNLLSSYPVLSYMVVEVDSDLSFIVLTALACVCIWRLGASRSSALAMPVVWMGTLLVVAPFNVTAWRYSFEALVPFTLLAGLGIFYLLPKPKGRKVGQNPVSVYWKAALVLLLVLVPVIVSSEGAAVVGDAVSDSSLVAQNQNLVYQSIGWLGTNTLPNSSYLSVSDQRFTYTSLIIDRNTTFQFESSPSSAQQFAHSIGAGYVIVTDLVTLPVTGGPPPSLEQLPWNTFPTGKGNSNLSLVYQNADVRIYKIV